MRAWKLVLYSRVLAPSPLNCIRFFTKSRGCTKTVAPILKGSSKTGKASEISGPSCNPAARSYKGQGLTCSYGFRRLVGMNVSVCTKGNVPDKKFRRPVKTTQIKTVQAVPQCSSRIRPQAV